MYSFSHLLRSFLLLQVLQVPFAISFQQSNPNTGAAAALDFFVIAVFFADILCTFNTSFVDFHSDQLVIDRRIIAASYLQAWFWLDLVSSIPFDQISVTSGSGTGAVRVVRVLRLLRLTRLFKLARLMQFNRLKQLSQDMAISVAVTNVIVLLLQVHSRQISQSSHYQSNFPVKYYFFVNFPSYIPTNLPPHASILPLTSYSHLTPSFVVLLPCACCYSSCSLSSIWWPAFGSSSRPPMLPVSTMPSWRPTTVLISQTLLPTRVDNG